ncbi:MAG: hypothetical protein QRY71_02680 [Candidatus Rhabdochlamydia sp.]
MTPLVIKNIYGKNHDRWIQASIDQKNLWNNYPLQLSIAEQKIINVDGILTVMRDEAQLPSLKAGFQKPQTFITIRLDQVYQTAIGQYHTDLAKAELEDQNLIAENTKIPIYEDSWFVGIRQLLGTQFISQVDFNNDARTHRYAWLIYVNSMEKMRLEVIRDEIKKAINPVIANLEELEKDNVTDSQMAKEIYELRKVYHAHFPGSSLPEDAQIKHLLSSYEEFADIEEILKPSH